MMNKNILTTAAKNFIEKGGLDSIKGKSDKQLKRMLQDYKVFNDQLGSTVQGALEIQKNRINRNAVYTMLEDGTELNLTQQFHNTIQDIKPIMDACTRDEYLWIELRDVYIDNFDNGKIMSVAELIKEANKILKEHGQEPIGNVNNTSATRLGSANSTKFTRRKR